GHGGDTERASAVSTVSTLRPGETSSALPASTDAFSKMDTMAERRVIFFDVGNTLLFPNRAKMLAPISSDRHPTLEQWQALERRTKQEFDQGMQNGRVDHGF